MPGPNRASIDPKTPELAAEGHFGRHLRLMQKVYAQHLSGRVSIEIGRITQILSLEARLLTFGVLCNGINAESTASESKRNVAVSPTDCLTDGKAVVRCVGCQEDPWTICSRTSGPDLSKRPTDTKR